MTNHEDCPYCEGTGWADDPSACSDPEHCDPIMRCPLGCPDDEYR